ncbi:GFA family protein [Alkanindiges hydrocarboniclasticus]|uniref:GFA family protein n=1 Tax=Alkanindiges hydrocarboniclasticus TaxID=1907941 RepID=UPI0026A6FF04
MYPLIDRTDFKLLKGATGLKEFSSSPGVNRVFCGDCGAPIYSKRDNDPVHYRLRQGTLDTPLSHGPSLHVCVASKAEWKMICDG